MHLKENITTLTASSSNQELENTPLISLPEVSQPTTSNTLNQDDLHSMSCSPMHPAINSCPRKEHECNDYEDCDDLVCVGECAGKPVAPDTAATPIAETAAAEPTGLPEGQTDCKR